MEYMNIIPPPPPPVADGQCVIYKPLPHKIYHTIEYLIENRNVNYLTAFRNTYKNIYNVIALLAAQFVKHINFPQAVSQRYFYQLIIIITKCPLAFQYHYLLQITNYQLPINSIGGIL